MKRTHLLLLCLWAALVCSCDRFEYYPYEGRIEGATHLTQSNLRKLQKKQLGNSFKFAFISDTQRWYDDTDDAVASINLNRDIDFIIHGGDLTDFGLTHEFEWMRDCLLKLRKPWLTIIGNHDYLGHGEHIYAEMFGETNYSFTIGHVRFLMLNTIALENDYSTPIPDFGFLEAELDYIQQVNLSTPDSITRTISIMHSRPGDEQFNNNVAVVFDRYLRAFPNMVCFNGHNHRYEVLEPFNDGILFWGVNEIHDRIYFIITIDNDQYDVQKVSF